MILCVVSYLSCFLGVKTQTALSTLVEVGDFKRFASAKQFASYLGLTPGEGKDKDYLMVSRYIKKNSSVVTSGGVFDIN